MRHLKRRFSRLPACTLVVEEILRAAVADGRLRAGKGPLGVPGFDLYAGVRAARVIGSSPP